MDGKENTKGAGTEEELEEEEDDDNQQDSITASKSEGDKKSGKSSKDNQRSFTQDQVNRMMTREKKQGRAAAYKELGIDPTDSKMIKMFQAFVESQKTDEQKNLEKEAEEKSKQAEAEHRVLVAEAKAEAMMLGVKSQYVEDAVTLALSKTKDGSSDIKTVLTELKGKYNIWFNESDDDDDEKGKDKKNSKAGKTGQKGTGAPLKEGSKKSKEGSMNLGARLAAQRKTNSGKKSYWGSN